MPTILFTINYNTNTAQVGDVTVTNDGATILKLLEVEHPAAKVQLRNNFAGDSNLWSFMVLLYVGECLAVVTL